MDAKHRLVAVIAAIVLPAGCAGGGDADPSPPGRSAPESAGGRHTAPAGDGTDLAACADGECEVRVTPATKLPVPPKTEVEDLRVVSIGSGRVVFTGRFLGAGMGGGCSGACDSSGSGGGFRLSLGPASRGTENGLAITVVAIGDGSATVRLTAA